MDGLENGAFFDAFFEPLIALAERNFLLHGRARATF
jgi:hypothetical protein